MKLLSSLTPLLFLAGSALGHGGGYGQQQQFVPKRFAAPTGYGVQQQFVEKQTVIRQQQFAAPAYAPVQAAPAYCAPVQAAPIYAAPVAAPIYGQQQFAPGKGRSFLPGRGLFGGRGQQTFRQRTFFRGNGGAGVQAQFGAY